MSGVCKTCSIENNPRQSLENLLRAGAPVRLVAAEYGLTPSSLRRHMTRHMNPFPRSGHANYSRTLTEYLTAHPDITAEIATKQSGGAA